MITLLHALKYHPDIIAISEHWLTENNKDSFFINGFKEFQVVRKWGTHGGVSIFVRDNIDVEFISNCSYSDKNIEVCTVSIKIGKQKFNVVAVYRPKSKHKDVDNFTYIFAKFLKKKCLIKRIIS